MKTKNKIENNMKNVARVHRATGGHWVGDGFPVNTMFSYQKGGSAEISPFLMMDYAGPAMFEPSDRPRGVEQHPHRGFETVTIVYQGELEHSDSAGNSGKIGPGDVQWMTAARGILHEEMHSRDFTKSGGAFEVIQLWVNLPAKDKMSDPHYQEILNADIPVVDLPGGAGTMRLIAGEYAGRDGAAETFTPVNLWDMRMKAGHETTLQIPDGHNAMVFVLSGRVTVNGDETLSAKEIAQMTLAGNEIFLQVEEDAKILLLSGQPIEESVAGYGPFVMNTPDEIRVAFADYAAGRF